VLGGAEGGEGEAVSPLETSLSSAGQRASNPTPPILPLPATLGQCEANNALEQLPSRSEDSQLIQMQTEKCIQFISVVLGSLKGAPHSLGLSQGPRARGGPFASHTPCLGMLTTSLCRPVQA